MTMLKIEKLCKQDQKDESAWILTHAKFCRPGDIVRIKSNHIHKVISMPIWDKASQEWDIRLV